MPGTKQISFAVPYDFETPTHLLNSSPQQIAHALQLAETILDSGFNFARDSDIKHLHEQIKQLKSTTVESIREEAIRLAKAEIKAEVSGKESLLHELRKQQEDMKHYLEELKAEKLQLNAKLQSKEQKVDELQEKLQQRIAIQSNSSKRGLEGERDFEILTYNMKEWTLESVGKTKESADFRSIIHSMEVRFEIKNHETDVPYNKNVDKFERDMKLHPQTKVGVFVAMTARIDKMDDSISVRWTDEKQLLIFIPYFLTRDLSYTYDIIESFIRTMKYLKPYLETKDTSKDVQMLTDKITKSISTVQMLDTQVGTMLKDHQDYNTKTIANYEKLKSLVLSSLTDLTGKEQEDTKAKKKPRTKKGENSE